MVPRLSSAIIFSLWFLLLVAASPDEADSQLKGLPPSSTGVGVSSGSSLSLTDKLGPLVINKDGSTNRITNWAEMTDEEKARTLRIITTRNRRRLEILRSKEEL